MAKSRSSKKSKEYKKKEKYPATAMTNEQRLKCYAKQMFSNRYCGFFVYRNPPVKSSPTANHVPKSTNKSNKTKDASKSADSHSNKSNASKITESHSKNSEEDKGKFARMVNPIASTIGSKVFSKPDFDGLRVDSGRINYCFSNSNLIY